MILRLTGQEGMTAYSHTFTAKREPPEGSSHAAFYFLSSSGMKSSVISLREVRS